MQIINFSIIFLTFTGAVLAMTAFIAGLWLVVNTQLFHAHLKRTNYQRWVDLTTLDAFSAKIGPGAVNPSKFLAFLKSRLDDEDEETLRYKHSLRITLRYMVIFIIASFLTFGFALGVSLYGN